MKKNGFTLVELIATIAIIALIGLVISTNMLGMFSQEEDKDLEDFQRRIEEAACMYVEVVKRTQCSNGCTINIDELINNGYVDQDIKDPSTGETVKGNNKYNVTVSWSNNERICKMR